MKLHYLYFVSVLFLFVSCSGDESANFAGEWQSINDPSKKLNISQDGKGYVFELASVDSPFEGLTGMYNDDRHALEFDNGTGTITTFVYNSSSKHILALGEEFEKTSEANTDSAETTLGDDSTVEETNDIAADPSSEEPEATPVSNSKCAKGDAIVINGNNVRLRSEPDVTKQNILLQLNKGNEVVHLDDKDVAGQKWYKVCHDGQTGWVSGQFASLK